MVGGGIVKLKTWQQAAVALGSAVGALLDPRRADLIAALGETTGKPAFQRVLQRMKSSPQGRVSNFHFLLFFQFTCLFLLFRTLRVRH
jgi:ubiquinone biosynthesis protein COQ4